MKKNGFLIAYLISVAITAPPEAQATGPGGGLVEFITPAPISPDGVVAGATPDFVINFAIPRDPNVPGLALRAGDSVTVTLPDAFTPSGIPNIQTPFTVGCAPPFPSCSTAILLQGWPQHPTGFPPPTIAGKWSVSQGATPNQIVVTALIDLPPAPPLEPGTKQLHLFLSDYVNPQPGHYTIEVETSSGQTGSAPLQIVPRARPAIAVTSLFGAAGNPNTIFQGADANRPAQFDYNFLLWEREGIPAIGVEIVDGRLVQGTRTVGHLSIEAPAGAVGHSITSIGPSFPIVFPVSGRDAGRLTASFVAGSEPGIYRIRLSIVGGNEVTMHVEVD